MKRKFKLFATVASLCLSVALMAFGVYAASTVTYTVSGSVNYEVKHALVTVTTTADYLQVKGGEGGQEWVAQTAGYKTTPPSASDLAESPDVRQYVTGGDAVTDGSWSSYDSSTGLAKDETSGSARVAVDFNQSTVWRITINVKTANDSGVNVTLTDGTYAIGGEANFGIVAAGTYTTATKVDKATIEGTNFVFYVYLEDVTLNITEADAYTFEIPLTIAQATQA